MKRTFVLAALLVGLSPAATLHAQLFDNLRALGGTRYSVGDPSVTSTNLDGETVDGPKDINVADLDGDGHPDLVASDKDGTVTIRYGVGDGTFGEPSYLRTWTTAPLDLHTLYFTNYYTNIYCDFQPTNKSIRCFTNVPYGQPAAVGVETCFTNFEYGCVGSITNIHTNVWHIKGPTGLRGLAVADLTGDGRRDIAVASPGEQLIYLFINLGARDYMLTNLPGWLGVRDLAAGDFDGDGLLDLAAAGGTNGVAQFRSLGNGAFLQMTNVLALKSDPLDEIDQFDYEFPQPAYYLKAVRQPGDTKDELVASFAQQRRIWILRADAEGRLVVTGDIEHVNLTALDAGPLLGPATNGAPIDLVTSYSRGGYINIFAASTNAQRFVGSPTQWIYVPGALRNIRIVDLDQDGWNDLVVVAQGTTKVLTYHNQGGVFTLATEALTGLSPREMDIGDFNDDTLPDLAVLNRYSSDVSIFLASTNYGAESGFLALDSVYPVDGGVSGLELRDFNGDGRLDVVQLHRDSSEFSVRYTGTNGVLSPPVFIPITNATFPSAQSAVDVNNDGLADLVSANLSGSVTVRLGEPGGGFGPEKTFSLPPDQQGSLFALVPGDFDGDGNIDLAAGYLDCRVSFFKGDGQGHFVFTHTHQFIYEPRSMAAADLDQDGDLDLIGGSWMDRFVVVENKGDLTTTDHLVKTEFGGNTKSGSTMKVVDQNNDGDPDLVFGTESGFTLWLGGPGLTFAKQPTSSDPGVSGSTFVSADLDGDGDNDLASICATNSCLSIQTYTNGGFVTVLTVPVPPTRYLAAGDLDGDGFVDLVGSGDVLWVALSSRRATNAAPSEPSAPREGNRGVVINEILAQNDSLPVAADGERFSDWVEVYNGRSQAVAMAGWSLLLVKTVQVLDANGNSSNVPVTNLFRFPNDAPLERGGRRLLVCSDRIRSVYHTGFNLPAEGGLVCLFDAQSNEVDRVNYTQQRSDISYARYTDGSRSFVMNSIPSPGAPNVDNGAVDPVLSFTGIDLETLQTPGEPLRFRATARDDVGIVNVSVLWRRLDIPDSVTKRIILYDDGINEDGPANDGKFFGVMPGILPDGAEIQFYVECTDLTDQIVTTPGNARFASAGQSLKAHTLAVGVSRPPLEISEIVPVNLTGLFDEGGGRPDWVEIRNTSSQPVSLAGIGLGPKFFGDGERFALTNRATLAAGEHLVVFADSKPSQGPWHAPFRLDREGETLVLTGTTPTGGRYLIDAVTYAPQSPDRAWARQGAGGPWVESEPTPRAGNISTPWRSVILENTFYLVFPTRPGRTYTVENNWDLGEGQFISQPPVIGTGVELAVPETMGTAGYFRVREQ
jgi:hypothetical protein